MIFCRINGIYCYGSHTMVIFLWMQSLLPITYKGGAQELEIEGGTDENYRKTGANQETSAGTSVAPRIMTY